MQKTHTRDGTKIDLINVIINTFCWDLENLRHFFTTISVFIGIDHNCYISMKFWTWASVKRLHSK